MILSIDDLREEARAFYAAKVWVFVKRYNAYAQVEFINGLIVEEPTDTFFKMQDSKKPEMQPKVVFFKELIKPGAFLIQSKKQGSDNE